MSKLKPFIGIVLIFVLGLLAGTVGTKLYYKHKFERMPEPLAYHKQVALKRMDASLDLTPAQSQAIATIMNESEQRIMQLMAPHAREIDILMATTQARIMAELDADQQQKFTEDLKLIRQNRQHHMRMRFRMQMSGPMPHGVPPIPRNFEEGPPPDMLGRPPQHR